MPEPSNEIPSPGTPGEGKGGGSSPRSTEPAPTPALPRSTGGGGTDRSTSGASSSSIAPLWPALFGIAITLTLRGYQFGQSNHAVYLIDPLRRLDPTLLANDWWSTATLQYHFAFSWLTELLLRLDIIEPAFFILYLALITLLHIAWLKIVYTLAPISARGTGASPVLDPQPLNDPRIHHHPEQTKRLPERSQRHPERSEGSPAPAVYLLSVLLYHLSAGGLGLGVYHFLQDSSFLPSNVSNVAMLWGIYFWITRRHALAGATLGIAGLFHLNYAIIAIAGWFTLSLWNRFSARSTLNIERSTFSQFQLATRNAQRATPRWLLGTAALLVLSLASILPALATILHRTDHLPLAEFIDLYVRLRHPHHYDPLSWHWALWLSFLGPIPLALLAWRNAQAWHGRPARADDAINQTARIILLLSAMLLITFLFAGIWFISESLVQLSLWRFSIYIKLLTCIAAAALLLNLRPPLPRLILIAAIVLSITGILITILANKGDTTLYFPPFLTHNARPLFLFFLITLAALLWIVRPWKLRLPPITAAVILCALSIILAPKLGLRLSLPLDDDPEYLALCAWARNNTPADAIFLVPPDEQSFRLHARRAIVVNFKGVPQLSGELPEWRNRLQDVLDMPDLTQLPRPFHLTLAGIRQRYANLPPDHLITTAHHYGAQYIVTTAILELAHVSEPTPSEPSPSTLGEGWVRASQPVPLMPQPQLIYTSPAGQYHLYVFALNSKWTYDMDR